MDIDATVLGPRPSLAPENLRCLANPPHPVSFSFIPVAIHLLTCVCPRVYSELPAWKRLISPTLSAHDRISLITSIFLDRNEVEVVGNLSGYDAQTYVNVVNEVSIHILPPSTLTPTNTPVLCWLDTRRPSAIDPQEVSALFIQDLCLSSPASEIIDNSTLLQPDGNSAVPRRICGRVEGSI